MTTQMECRYASPDKISAMTKRAAGTAREPLCANTVCRSPFGMYLPASCKHIPRHRWTGRVKMWQKQWRTRKGKTQER